MGFGNAGGHLPSTAPFTPSLQLIQLAQLAQALTPEQIQVLGVLAGQGQHLQPTARPDQSR